MHTLMKLPNGQEFDPNNLPDPDQIFKDAMGLVRSFELVDDKTFSQLLLSFEYVELIGMLAGLSGFVSKILEFMAEERSVSVDELYNTLINPPT